MANERRSRGPRVRTVPTGDDRSRLTCPECGYIAYENPKIVVGTVCTWEDRILLCRRDIEPQRGYWTLPAGFLELHEAPETGACREAWEEARARIDLEGLLAVYSIPRISQVQLIYRARLRSPHVVAADETREVALFPQEEIPWSGLAFPTVRWALTAHHDLGTEAPGAPARNPAGETPDVWE